MDIKAYIESGVIESYVLGLASPDEVSELEALSIQHSEVRAAIDAFAESIQRQAMGANIAPPPEIKQQLMERLAGDFKDTAAAAVAPPKLSALPGGTANGKVVRMVSFKLWRNVAAAAVILLVVSAALNVYYYKNYAQTTSKYQALLAERNTLQAANDNYHQTLNIIHDSVMQIVRMPGVPGKQNNMATVYWDTKTRDVYVYANNLQQAPAGKQYQLWALVDGKPVDAGVISDCKGICKMKNIGRAQAFAITLENEGGSPSPTLTAMYALGKV